ncbi:MAG: Stp1/IreP family PP2C-type Ser/Thr phosphatase [Oscillospiraceae bacterium]|nr:Stp1/IreP family PP2C-type Ser/Thr phosphatase [Oscillospiraceae bacterium]
MDFWAITDKGAVRQQNQDTFFKYYDEETGIGLFLICDGMGGARAGEVASSLAAETFSEELLKSVKTAAPSRFEELMKAEAAHTNSVVFGTGLSDDNCRGMGTTLVAVLLCYNEAVVLNIGDSRAYHITDEEIKQITRDHSVVEDMVVSGEITREESRNHPRKNLITRALGTAAEVECDLFKLEISEGDSILLCSDGLTNLVEDEEIKETVSRVSDTKECCEKLLESAIERGAPDNVTVVLFRK